MEVLLTESQLRLMTESTAIKEVINEAKTFKEVIDYVHYLLTIGCSVAGLLIAISNATNLSLSQKEYLKNMVETEQVEQNTKKETDDWQLISDDTMATVYNAVPEQCNNDVRHTASMFKLNLNDVLSHRIIAMERTMMKEYGLKYGDVVKIEGTGKWDGIWQIQDTMNKRFVGQHKIDILVPNNIKHGKWDNVKIYALKDKADTSKYKTNKWRMETKWK